MPTGGANIIDSLFVALGFQVDAEGLKSLKRQTDEAKEYMLGLGDVIKTFLVGEAVSGIAEVNSTFERNRIQIAGYLSALGESSDFNAGLKDAADVIQQITKDAAILPGEADEYIEVFKGGLPFIQGAMPGGSLKEMVNFSNQLTAIGKTFGLDAGLIAREFDHMLSPGKGTAGLRLPLFRQLMPFLRKVQGQAKLTTESFNAMTAPKRLQLLQAAFTTLQPMLDASESTFDAMWGAMKSAFKTLVRFGTSGIFAAMKSGLDKWSSAVVGADGKLTKFGQEIADTANMIGRWIVQLLGAGGQLVVWFAKSEYGAKLLKFAMIALGVSLAGMAIQGTISMVMKLFSSLFNLKRLLTSGLFLAIALIAEDLYVFSKGGDSVTGMLKNKFPGAFETATRLANAFADALGAVVAIFKVLTQSSPITIGDDVAAQMSVVGDQMTTLKEVIIGAAAAIAIALTVAFAPVTATIASITSLIAVFTQLKNHNGFFNDAVKGIGKRIIGGLGLPVPADVQDMGGGGVLAAPQTGDWHAWEPPQAAFPASAGAGAAARASAGGSGGSVTSHDDHSTKVGQITVVSPNPEAAGRAVKRALTRNAQTGTGY